MLYLVFTSTLWPDQSNGQDYWSPALLHKLLNGKYSKPQRNCLILNFKVFQKICTNRQGFDIKCFLLWALGPSPHRWEHGCLDYAGQCSRSFCLCLQNRRVWRPHWLAGPKLLHHAPGRWQYNSADRVTTSGWSRLNCPTDTVGKDSRFKCWYSSVLH